MFTVQSTTHSIQGLADMNLSKDLAVETIGPKRAKELLEANTNNRRLRKARVTQYTQAMMDGRWKANGAPILIARDGTLLDGQHRLSAIIESGKRVPMVVVTNLDPNVQDTIDIGAARTAGDQMAIHGFANATTLAAAARLAIQYEGGAMSVAHKGFAVTPDIIRDFVNENPSLIEQVNWMRQHAPSLNKTGLSVTMFAFMAFESKGLEFKAREFVEAYKTKIGLTPDSPVLALLTYIEQNRYGKRPTPRMYLMALIKAYNAYARDEPMKLLKVQVGGKGEAFPKVVTKRDLH